MRIKKSDIYDVIDGLSKQEQNTFFLLLQYMYTKSEVSLDNNSRYSKGILIDDLISDLDLYNKLENLLSVLKKNNILFPKQDSSLGIRAVHYISPLKIISGLDGKNYILGWNRGLINQFYEVFSQIQIFEKKKAITRKVDNDHLYKGGLFINKGIGFVSLNEIGGALNLSGKEFKTILILATNKNNQATYDEILGNENNKTNRRLLGFTIRNIKRLLGILPEKTRKNKDIIKNIKNYGYKLLLNDDKSQ